MKTKNIPVVIFGDYIAAYGVIRALAHLEIPIYIVSQTGKGLSIKSRFVRKSLTLRSKESDFITKLYGWLFKEVGNEAVLMVAGDDDYLDVLAKNYDKLPSGLRPTFPKWDIVRLVREKRSTYKIAEELDIPIPKTYSIASKNELEDLLNKGIKAEFPMLMKPENSAQFLNEYKAKGIICNHPEEILANYDKYDGFYGELLLQEMIPGEENLLYNLLGVFNADSDPIAVFMNRKRRSGRQFLSCTVMESMWSDEVLEYSLKLVKKIGYVGYANPEFKFDHRDGKLKLMEVNGRITISNSHALRCGINVAYVMYREALDGPLPEKKELSQCYPNNILWCDIFADCASALRLFLKRKLTIKEYLSSIKGAGYIFEPFDHKDPLPAICLVKNYFCTLLAKLRG